MIALDLKPEKTSSSPLSLTSSKDEPSIDFSKLLQGMKVDKKNVHIVQNGSLVLSLNDVDKDAKVAKNTAKNDTLLALLKNKDTKDEQIKDSFEINPKLTDMLGAKELKNLVSDAKNYLKTKIVQSDDYKQQQIKELPKTLKGLALLAKKVGVDITKITFQEVQPKSKNTKTPKQNSVVFEKKPKTKTTALSHAKDMQTVTPKDTENIKPNIQDVKREESFILKDKKPQISKEFKDIPVFKPQTSSEHTTEQLVQVKQFKVEKKTPKDRADETLKLLLKGERASEQTQNLTADFSVQSAKVIAPKATTQVVRDIESLLHDKKTSEDEVVGSSKTESLSVHKADSFEVKLNEAKQMIKYLSQDVKTAIEDYRSPFTRVKVQLNPQRLGEIDLTVVQRGKNLHVNLTSNSSAINALSMNVTELKTQLSNNGINNATLNFNSNSQNTEQQNSQQHHQQNGKKAQEEYSYLIEENINEEILTSLEIVVPRYI
jgi:flagellar hook-length control protein FliK